MTDHQSTSTATASTETESPTHVCDVCGRAFHTDELLVLHRGVRHPGDLDETERQAYREAYAAEEREIRSFRIRALFVLVILYFGFLLLYVFYASP
ncbi:DNA-binding protein [Halobellus ordinarius]|uniref:DNA-binding protein n=1 Tax=Halobellus ordinarius TaxID=3075120 RepID=UPI0028808DF3|nr:DNA-binding protein [Halobellus sp. ZY16]